MISYIGNGDYCYANAAAMLLAANSENIAPSRIEVLGGVGLGAFWIEVAEGFPHVALSLEHLELA